MITAYVMLTIMCGRPISAAALAQPTYANYVRVWGSAGVEESAERLGSRLSMCNLCVRSTKDNNDNDDDDDDDDWAATV